MTIYTGTKRHQNIQVLFLPLFDKNITPLENVTIIFDILLEYILEFIAAGISDIGRKRDTNQDSIYLNNNDHVYIVADGMGGHSGGELASTMAVKHMSEYLKSVNLSTSRDKHMKDAILFANNQIKSFADNDETLKGMGTTVVSMIFGDDTVTIGNVGDSRAYLISRENLFQLSKDHSLVQEKMNMGLYTRQQALEDPHKNILSRTVGFEENVKIDVFSYKLKKGDFFLICSDGLHGKVSDEDIIYMIKKDLIGKKLNFTKIRDCVQRLVRQANENGGQDNISVIIAAAQ